jgi:anti-sigma regulatory factor (Ser/Thr protein kinase)
MKGNFDFNTEVLQEIIDFVDQFCTAHELSVSQEKELHIVVEELVTNSIKYGQLLPSSHLTIDLLLKNNFIDIRYVDPGCQFDPIEYLEKTGTTHSDTDFQVGGVGLRLILHYSKFFNYKRVEECNHIHIRFDLNRERSG